jgi:hypothetical protein
MNPALEYIDRAPEPFRAIMLHLQVLVEASCPSAQLKYKWHLPFYYLDDKTMFCFFNYRKTFVDLGLAYGNLLSDSHGVLVAGENRKMMRSLRFCDLESVDDEIVIETLQELEQLRIAAKKKTL